MRKNARTLSLLLCLCMALSLLTGCSAAGTPAPAHAAGAEAAQAPSPDPTPEPTPEPSPDPTPEPIDYLALYQQAYEALAAQQNLAVDYQISREITLPNFASKDPGALTTIAETTERSLRLQGLGGDALLAAADETITLGDYPQITQKLLYTDGTEYVQLNADRFCSVADRDAFLAQLPPLPLLDPSLCGPVTGEETGEGYALHFDALAGAEAWAVPEEAELLEADGSASLSAEGTLSDTGMNLRYRFGGLDVLVRYEVRYSTQDELDLSAEMPENPEAWETLEDPTAPLAVLRAGYLIDNAKASNATLNFNYYSEAGGISLRYFETESLLNRGVPSLYHGEFSISGMDYSHSDTFSNSYEEDFSQQKLTTTYSDGETETDSIYYTDVLDFYRYNLLQYYPTPACLKDAESTDLGAYRLITFAGTEEYGEAVKGAVQDDMFPSQPTILDDLANSYETKNLTGFLAVEKVSGIPTALNLDYSGTHTIEGHPYSLAMKMNIGMNLYTDDAARAILDEPTDGPEPENRPTPVFYQVSDDEGHSMYLFGTIHLGDDRTAYLPQVIYDALDASDALAVEFDVDSFEDSIGDDAELQQRLMQSYFYTDGTTIQNHLDAEIYQEALNYIKAAGSYNDTAEAMKPTLWANGLEQFYLSQGRQLSSAKGVDNRLMRLARGSGKEILDVESGEFQVSMLTGYSDPVQEMLLSELLSTSRGEYLKGTYELYEAWCAGDEQALIERLAAMDEEDRSELDETELALYDEYHQKMEVERNAAMVEVAKGYLTEGRKVFFAVGLAHLLGEGGLVHALRDAGFTVTLIDTH